MSPARSLTCLALAGFGAVVLAACNPTSPYAAIVNGDRISQAQVTRELRAFAANRAFLDLYTRGAASQNPPRPGIVSSDTAHRTFTQSFTSTVLGLDIQSAVIHSEALRRHVEPAAAAVDSSDTQASAGRQFGSDAQGQPIFPRFSPWLRHLFQLRQAEEDALNKVLPAPPSVDPTAIQRFYDENPQDFITSQCVSHILVKTEADATAVAARLAAGEDFASVASQTSTDAATASKGGDLGCSSPSSGTNPVEQDPAFAQRSVVVPVGQVSPPIQVTSGWDVFKVTKRDEQPLSDTVKQEIQAHLQQGQPTTPIGQFLQHAATSLKVTVNPQYGRWDPQNFVIVPPATPDPVRSGVPTSIPSGAAAAPTSP